MNNNLAVEIVCEDRISLDKFWELANDLFYTKLYYDNDTQEYYKEALTASNETEYSEEDMNMLLVSYITLSATHCDRMVEQFITESSSNDKDKEERDKDKDAKEEEFYQNVAAFMLDTNYYKNNKEFCIRKMISLLKYITENNLFLFKGLDNNTEISKPNVNSDPAKLQIIEALKTNQNMIRIIGWILYVEYNQEGQDSKDKMPFLQILRDYQGFESIANILASFCKIYKRANLLDINKNQFETPISSHSYSNYLEIFYDLCDMFEFNAEELMAIDDDFFDYLLNTLKVRTKVEDISNFLKFKIILILNEKYMVVYYSQHGHSQDESLSKGPKIQNKIFNTLLQPNLFSTFTETLILNFNRESDNVIQILMLKVLFLVFTTTKTCQWIYLNDLKVLIDIFIRELFNLSVVKQASLINTYLRVLCPLVLFSNLKTENCSYKFTELAEVLNYLNNSDESDETTKRLAQRCIDLEFFQEKLKEKEEKTSDVGDGSGSLSSSYSASAPLPPLPETSAESELPTEQLTRQMSEISIQSTITNSSSDTTPNENLARYDSLLSRNDSGVSSDSASISTRSSVPISYMPPAKSSMGDVQPKHRSRKRPPPPPPRKYLSDSNLSLASNTASRVPSGGSYR